MDGEELCRMTLAGENGRLGDLHRSGGNEVSRGACVGSDCIADDCVTGGVVSISASVDVLDS